MTLDSNYLDAVFQKQHLGSKFCFSVACKNHYFTAKYSPKYNTHLEDESLPYKVKVGMEVS